jgi:molybdopterin-guanine dinucleotide biosynthesis protein A
MDGFVPGTDLGRYGAAIFCGGLSRRMGFDKAFLRLADGRSLLAVLAEGLGRRFGEVALVTDDPAKFRALGEVSGFRKIRDLHPLAGPAGALRTALASMDYPKIFVMACDIPSLDISVVDALAAKMESLDADITLPRLGERFEPLFAFYGKKAEAPLLETISAGRLAIREIFPRVRTVFLDLDPLNKTLITNMNTPSEAMDAGCRGSK